MKLMPWSSAAWRTRWTAASSRRGRPKLLLPSPTADTRRLDVPRVRYSIRGLLRVFRLHGLMIPSRRALGPSGRDVGDGAGPGPLEHLDHGFQRGDRGGVRRVIAIVGPIGRRQKYILKLNA